MTTTSPQSPDDKHFQSSMSELSAAQVEDTTATGSYNKAEVEKLAENDMNFLAALCLPKVCTAAFPDVFVNIWALIVGALLRFKDFSKFAIGLPRGHGKTTVIKILIIYIILFTKRRFILVTCASVGLAENILADVSDILDSPNIREVFGDWTAARETDRTDLKKFRFRNRDIILAAMGSGGRVRGLNVKNARPDVMICDDVQTRDESESEPVSKKLLTWFVGTLMKSKSPAGCTYIYVGNMYRDIKVGGIAAKLYTCILRNLQKNPQWISWIVGALLKDGTALWEEVQPKEQLLAELENDTNMGQAEVFFSEVLNDPNCGTGQHFDINKLPEFDVDPELDIEVGRFLLIDPSLGKKTSDAQVVLDCSVFDGVPVVNHVHIKQVDAPVLVEWTINYAIKNKIPLIVSETVAYQGTLLQWFNHYITLRSISGIALRAIAPGGRKKNSRILDSFKQVMSGDIKIHPRCLAVWLSQVVAFDPISKSNSDDVLDTVAYTTDVILNYPNELMISDFLELEADHSTELLEQDVLGASTSRMMAPVTDGVDEFDYTTDLALL